MTTTSDSVLEVLSDESYMITVDSTWTATRLTRYCKRAGLEIARGSELGDSVNLALSSSVGCACVSDPR